MDISDHRESDDRLGGYIYLSFSPYDEWPSHFRVDPQAVGAAEITSRETGKIVKAVLYVDDIRSTGTDLLTIVVHELIHALGRSHPDPRRFPDSIMTIAGVARDQHTLYPLDRAALNAAHGWLDPGDTPAALAYDLGEWETESYHIRGDIVAVDGAAFGVAYNNFLSQPWASGPTPWTDLADNPELTGVASWEGAMIGFDFFTGNHVGSDADLAIALDSLVGTLDFTNIRSWQGGIGFGSDPGGVWKDGDLTYGIEVRGNTFVQFTGDDGIVTGAFFGARHEAMGGTLQRDDLTGAFGGSR